MNGYGFLFLSLSIGVFGIGLYKAGPMLDRWSVRLKDDLERMRRGDSLTHSAKQNQAAVPSDEE